MTNWRARIGVVAVFVVGFLCGGVTLQLVRARAVSHALHQPDAWVERVTRLLGRRLDLTREQRQEVHAILVDARRKSAGSLQRVQPEMLANFDRTQDRIRAVLDAKQRGKFEQISARRRAKFLERFGPPGGAPAGPAAPVPSPPPPSSQPR
jgi:hypothetical protein